jgi:hypothetical protein
MEKKMGNKNELSLSLSYNILNLKTPSFIFSNLFLIPRTLCPDYIYKNKEVKNEKKN